MEPFSDKIESVVNNEVTIRTTVRVATYELYLDWLYDTIACIGSFDNAYWVWVACSMSTIFTTGNGQFIIYILAGRRNAWWW